MRSVFGAVVIVVILPVIAVRCITAFLNDQQIKLYKRVYVGKNRKRITHKTLMISNVPLPDVDQWLHYLRGNFDLIGPKPLTEMEVEKLSDRDQQRLRVAPGIISPYVVKSRSGIAHKSEHEVSYEFANEAPFIRRIQLVAIYLLQCALRFRRKTALVKTKTFNLFGVNIANVSMQDALDRIIDSLDAAEQNFRQFTFAFVNADCANKYYRDESYKNVLNGFSRVFADGVGVKIAARWQGITLTENINGSDMFPMLCTRLIDSGKSLYLHGAKRVVIEELVQKLATTHPELKIAGYSDGFSYQDKPTELHEKINQSGADMLLVAMGAPRQEHWIEQHLPSLNIKVAMGVGGLFDFYSGQVARAPEWVRELSLEWVWRLAVQPIDKGQRYLLGNPLFLLRAFLARPTNTRSSSSATQKAPTQLVPDSNLGGQQ